MYKETLLNASVNIIKNRRAKYENGLLIIQEKTPVIELNFKAAIDSIRMNIKNRTMLNIIIATPNTVYV